MSVADEPEYYHTRGAEPEIWEPVEPDIPALRSLAREIVGQPATGLEDVPVDPDPPRPPSMLELDRYDKIVALAPADRVEKRRPLKSCRPDHLLAIRLLDRFGLMSTEQLHQAVFPGMTIRSTQALLQQLHAAGLVERRRTQLAIDDDRGRGGSTPRLWSLTSAGFRLGQKSPGFYKPVIPKDRVRRASETEKAMRLRHDLHAIGWCLAFQKLASAAVDIRDVLTPRYAQGQLQPPRMPAGHGHGSRPIELRDIRLGEGHGFAGIPDGRFTYALHPDLTIQMRIHGWMLGRSQDPHIDLLVEIDRTKRASYNRPKLARYDAFLTGWGLAHPRIQQLGTRPVVIFTSPDHASMVALMKVADQVMTGRIGWTGAPEHAWYYPGRDHTLFTTEDEIHRGSMLAWRLPQLPLGLRKEMYDDTLVATTVTILPPELGTQRVGREEA